tara:strand:- start:524 stop:1363 length:840 start_codon:yes stop_codon:yes gene_type:complete
MSGAAAVASARRRRASGAPEPMPPQRQVNNTQRQVEPDSNNQMTPLQILQLHDDKLTSMEEDFESRVEKIILEKMNKSNTLDSSNMTDSITRESNIMEQINLKIENALSVKLAEVMTINENNTNKVDYLVKEINELKMLVIKTQTLGLETNNDMIKMKDNIKVIEEYKNVPGSSNDIDNGLNFMKTMMGIGDLDIEKQENKALNIHDEVDDNENIIKIQDINDIRDCIIQELSNQNNEKGENGKNGKNGKNGENDENGEKGENGENYENDENVVEISDN